MRSWQLFAIVLLACGTVVALEPDIELDLVIEDNAGGMQVLTFGVDSVATDTLDEILGEEELPPFPPSGVFEARFIGDDINLPKLGQGTYKDYRPNLLTIDSTMVFELKYQVGTGSSIKIKWNWPEGATAVLQDLFGGVSVNKEMYGNDSLTVDNPDALNKLKMTATISSTVPVELAHFNAEIIQDQVVLRWRTESESNNLGFEVQKSTDEQVYATIGFVPGAGTTTIAQNYTFKDDIAPGETMYYRLKQTDTDGTYHYSKVVRVFVAPPGACKLEQNYPNPFNPQTFIEYSLPTADFVNISIYNLRGEKIKDLVSRRFDSGYHCIQFDAKGLASGIYFYVMATQTFTDTKRMILLP